MIEFRGRFLWYELMTNDPKAAQDFYMRVVGWGLQEWTGMDKPSPEAEAEAQLKDFSWHELATSDYEAAFAFYEKLFGWKRNDAVDMGPLGTYQMYGRGMYNKPKEMPAPPHWLLYTLVPDINEAAKTVKAAAGRVLNGPMEVPGGDWIVQCLDPQGARGLRAPRHEGLSRFDDCGRLAAAWPRVWGGMLRGNLFA